MKTAQDKRHLKRRKIVQSLFTWIFQPKNNGQSQKLIKDILRHREKIDKIITRCAPVWPIEKIAKIDLAILRLAIYELAVEKKEPPKVIIDEAVELAKEFAGEKNSGFINGVLGTVLKTEKLKV